MELPRVREARMTPVARRKIVADYVAGIPLKQIAAWAGATCSSVHRIARHAGVRARRWRRPLAMRLHVASERGSGISLRPDEIVQVMRWAELAGGP